ncbi:PAS domain-containing protein [Acanthopleuribacter pedis]|uniref:PAS domain-containing protein n=1 Tax=Acanthopleuribacter pedis TaxID=442870 RepID=A0A8J7Q187_9BACT|nr:PAS domain-containing protein [Acanthopleuribacter pedis]MBO1317229.1 PAS domain-containing protein [Acanthopleuribacter pedis]MBO1318535.1 PAS domain-containing protein [Acanthopleuribacter pedis]
MLPSSLNIGILCCDLERGRFLVDRFQQLRLVATVLTRETLPDWLEKQANTLVVIDLTDPDQRMIHTRTALETANCFFRPVLLLSERDHEAFEETDPFHYLHPDFTLRELRLSLELACFRHRVEGQTADAVKFSQMVMQQSEQALIQVDDCGAVVYMNTKAERLTGWMLQLARGRRLIEVFRLAEPDQVVTLEAMLAVGDCHEHDPETVMLHPYDGEPLEVECRWAAVLRVDQSVYRYLLSFDAVPMPTPIHAGHKKTKQFQSLARTS